MAYKLGAEDIKKTVAGTTKKAISKASDDKVKESILKKAYHKEFNMPATDASGALTGAYKKWAEGK
tara:strand:- start:65 stop:262 length:198 start_codon:yes stop_codon:yes gene_type:complete